MKIIDIWYEFDEWAEEIDEDDCNSDVIFELSDGSRWCSTFITYENLLSLVRSYQDTGELLSGQYFYADKPIFISKMEKNIILAALKNIIRNEVNLSHIFTRIG